MKLAVYGTLRDGEALSYLLSNYKARSKTITLTGIRLYSLGPFPAAKIGSKKDKAVVEIKTFNLTKQRENELLGYLDIVEGVDQGLYKRQIIDTPEGPSIIYIFQLSIKGFPLITDWSKES